MTTKIPIAELSRHIQQLVDERQKYVDAITRIDAALAEVGAAINGLVPSPSKATSVAPPPSEGRTAKGKTRRKQGRFAITGQEAILAFVKQRKNPTTQDIKKLWQDEGRGGRADTYLSAMVTNKLLKRTPLDNGVQGSRYSLA